MITIGVVIMGAVCLPNDAFSWPCWDAFQEREPYWKNGNGNWALVEVGLTALQGGANWASVSLPSTPPKVLT